MKINRKDLKHKGRFKTTLATGKRKEQRDRKMTEKTLTKDYMFIIQHN